MPLVLVTHDPKIVGYDVVRNIGPYLQQLVADALDVNDDPEGRLTKNEIEVCFREPGEFDVNSPAFSVKVFANDYPGRRKNIQQRTEMISEQIKNVSKLCEGYLPESIFGTDKNFVWVFLGYAGFTTL